MAIGKFTPRRLAISFVSGVVLLLTAQRNSFLVQTWSLGAGHYSVKAARIWYTIMV